MIVISFEQCSKEMIHAIYSSLLELSGKQVKVTINSSSRSDICIYSDIPNPKIKLKGKFNVLLMIEPETVLPRQYTQSIMKRFNLVIPMSPWRAERLGLKDWAFFPLEVRQVGQVSKDEKLRVKEVVMLNAAKFSAHNRSNYGLRRKISKRLHELEFDYELIGANWQMSKWKELRERIWAIRKETLCWRAPNLFEALSEFTYRYPEYRGPTENKLNELAKFMYALVIENESDWITEKLVDAISAGCVPIYIGPDLARLPLLQRCVIEINPSLESIVKFFAQDNRALYREKKSFIDNVQNYEEDLKKLSLEISARRIAAQIIQAYF